ncbi:MAG TPA: sugar ABC transporter substrate-binding protein [Chloroflexi bacterium]|nr:sugar ABC transporter substrate-binding protein [Chloroflexota bacterium]
MQRLSKLLVVLSLIAVLALAACTAPAAAPTGEQAAAGGQAAGGVTMSFWTRDSNQEQVRALVDAWNESHPNKIEITVIPASEYMTKVGASVGAGAPPDLMAVDLIYVPQFAAAGQLTDITDLAKALPYFEQLSPSHVRLATYDGKIFGLPFNAEGSYLMYNKGLFKQAGLDPENPPKTWGEIADAAAKIRALGDDIYGFYFSGSCAGCNAFTFMPLIWASGGDVLSDDGATATLTDPNVAAALEFYRQMWADDLIPPGARADTGTDFANAFTTGKIGMVGTGAFAINNIKTNFPEIEFGATFLPGAEGGASSFAGGDSIAIPAGSKYPNEAFEFIKWATSDEVQLEYYAKLNNLPVRTDLAKNEYFAADPRLTVAAEAMAMGKTPYTVVYNQLFNDANGPWLKMIQTAVFDGKVEEAVNTAQEEFTKILSGQ